MAKKTIKCESCNNNIHSYYIFTSNRMPKIKYREYHCIFCQKIYTITVSKKYSDFDILKFSNLFD